MTNIYLHGELRNLYGEHFKLNIESAKDTFRAINSNRKGFITTIKKLMGKGVYYRIIIDDEVVQDPKELDIQRVPKEIHIVPIVWGAGNNQGLQMILLAAVIVAVSLTGPVGAIAGGKLAAGLQMTAAALAVQGVMTLLYPPPKPDFNQEVSAGGKSYLFGSKPGNVSQGQAVPVGYGRLLIQSSQISATANHYPLSTNIKELMKPVDDKGSDYTEIIANDEAPSPYGLSVDGFSTNQATDLGDSQIFSSINLVNSYINILTTSVGKVASDPVEVIVKTNGEIVSNPNLDTYNPDISYEWKEISATTPGAIKMETAYAFNDGLVYRSYDPLSFRLKTNLGTGDLNTQPNYFNVYESGSLVKWGPTEFNDLSIGVWDKDYIFKKKELTNYQDRYFSAVRDSMGKAVISGASRAGSVVTVTTQNSHGFLNNINVDVFNLIGSGINSSYADGTHLISVTGTGTGQTNFTFNISGATGSEVYTTSTESYAIATEQIAPLSGSTVNTGFWSEVQAPSHQYIYKALKINTGVIPSLDATGWALVAAPLAETGFDSLTNSFPAFSQQGIYVGDVNQTNLQTIVNSDGDRNSVDNYMMEFYGYMYVEMDQDKVIDIVDAQSGVAYEITKIGSTGQWATIGLTGLTGTPIMPELGMTFVKNGTPALTASNGKVYPVRKFNFKIDSDDAGDLHIDGQLASSYYNSHGFALNNVPAPAIADIPSTTTEIMLTAGFHRLNARFQDGIGSDGLSIYYRSKLDGESYSEYQVLPSSVLKHRSYSDLSQKKNVKFSNKRALIPASSMVAGKKYKIVTLGGVNWSSIGASSPAIGSVFYRNNAAISGSGGYVFEDLFSYSQYSSAEFNRLVRFTAERPSSDLYWSAKSGLSVYKAKWQCVAKIGASNTLYSSPVKIDVKFLNSNSQKSVINTVSDSNTINLL
jgi:predicted phage tail protein